MEVHPSTNGIGGRIRLKSLTVGTSLGPQNAVIAYDVEVNLEMAC